MTVQLQNRWRSLLASFCLVAVVFLYAPFGAAAWALYSAACCKSGTQCPIHGHHHAQTPASSEDTMDCGHTMGAMTHCRMSCCENPDRPAVAPAIFVLPAPVTVTAAANWTLLVALSGPRNSVNSPEPLAPPPRSSASAA